jgi:hypothetical protein
VGFSFATTKDQELLMAIPDRTNTGSVSRFNVDFIAIGIALALAALIRLNILPQIKW